jgi:hypothetical protein
VLAETFPNNKFLMNGLILGLKVCCNLYSAFIRLLSGYSIIPECSASRRFIRCVGSKKISADYRLLHMHAHSLLEDKRLVVFHALHLVWIALSYVQAS